MAGRAAPGRDAPGGAAASTISLVSTITGLFQAGLPFNLCCMHLIGQSTPSRTETASLAALFRPEDLVMEASMVAADIGTAARDPDQPVDKGRAVDAVNGDRHVGEGCPSVGP